MTEDYTLAPGKTLRFSFATPKDCRVVSSWKKSARKKPNPVVVDAIELAVLGVRRWREAMAKRRVANSVQDIRDFIQDNPHAEVAALLVAKAPWLQKKTLVGLCHFRRTWSNNIYIDFLTVHPLIVRNPKSPLRGVGTALLFFLSCIAAEIGAKVIWGEATQNSAGFYRKIFGREDIKDLIYVTEAEYKAFKNRVEENLRSLSGASKPSS